MSSYFCSYNYNRIFTRLGGEWPTLPAGELNWIEGWAGPRVRVDPMEKNKTGEVL
jgi:hypothetical protein